MSRVLLTGGAGAIGTALARRLLADPAYELRVSDPRPAPLWMREGCEIHTGDLRVPAQATAATRGCSHVIHLASFAPPPDHPDGPPHTLLEFDDALHAAVTRAALERKVERFVLVSSAAVLERAELFPTPEQHLADCPPPISAEGFAGLIGERYCRAAHEEHGLPYTICRPFGTYGPVETPAAEPRVDRLLGGIVDQALAGARPLRIAGSSEQTRTPTHVEDVAEGILAALGSPAALQEDFNISAARELSVAEVARVAWEACGEPQEALALEQLNAPASGPQRSWPSVEKARELLGWRARIELEDGIARTVAAARRPAPAAHRKAATGG